MSNVKLSELRYGGAVIAFAPDPETLLCEKCKMVLDSSVRYPELLKIYFEGVDLWLFDKNFTPYTASVYLADHLLPTLLEHKEIVYHEKTF